MRIARLLLVALLLVAAACGDDDDVTVGDDDATSTTTEASEDATPVIGFEGLADMPAGRTLREVGYVEVRSFEDFGGFCFYAVPDGLDGRARLTVLSPDGQPMQDPLDGVIGRASSEARDSDPLGTDRIAIGATEDEVRDAYDDHEIVESPHKYVEGGHYLDVAPDDEPDGSLLRFETDGTVVTAIHGGSADVVQLVEGCA